MNSDKIVIELDKTYLSVLDDLRRSHPLTVTVVQPDRFDASSSEIAHAMIVLSATTLPFLTKIVVELIRARKHVSIKHKGMELAGLSEDRAESILRNLLEHDDPS